jgi:hypothetical protein
VLHDQVSRVRAPTGELLWDQGSWGPILLIDAHRIIRDFINRIEIGAFWDIPGEQDIELLMSQIVPSGFQVGIDAACTDPVPIVWVVHDPVLVTKVKISTLW